MKDEDFYRSIEQARLNESHATLPKTKEEWVTLQSEKKVKRLLWAHRVVGAALLPGAAFAGWYGTRWGFAAAVLALVQAWRLLRWEPTG